MSLRRAALPLLLLLAVLLGALTACSSSGGGSGSKQETAAQLLARSKKTLDNAKSLHFVLTSSNVPSATSGLTGGEGDIARPASFRGTLKVIAAGATVDVKVVSVKGKVYAQLPFTSGYSVVDPAQFGISDPAALLDPNTGISQLLTQVNAPKLGGEKRVGGEVVQEVTGTIPGDQVQKLLGDKNPGKPVDVSFLIAPDSGQLRRATLTGPFFTAGSDTTYTLDLSRYGEDVTITAPATG